MGISVFCDESFERERTDERRKVDVEEVDALGRLERPERPPSDAGDFGHELLRRSLHRERAVGTGKIYGVKRELRQSLLTLQPSHVLDGFAHIVGQASLLRAWRR